LRRANQPDDLPTYFTHHSPPTDLPQVVLIGVAED
jgi:hypothetical protein